MKCAQHNEVFPLIVIAVILLIGVGLVSMSCSGGDQSGNRPYEIFMSANVTTEDDLLELLPDYEAVGIQFERRESDKRVTYKHDRTIDGVPVGSDHILYQFDKKTQQCLYKKICWRSDLPEHLPRLNVTKEQAESMVEGKVISALLVFMPAESSTFSIKPMPKNPCWLVGSVIEEHEDWTETQIAVIDAVTGELLGGYGSRGGASPSEPREAHRPGNVGQ